MATAEHKSTNGKDALKHNAITPAAAQTPQASRHREHRRRGLRSFDTVFEDMQRWFFDPTAWLPFARTSRGFDAARMPRMDIVEKDHMLIVTAELPGVKKEEVHIDLRDGSLIISGEMHSEEEDEGTDYVRTERTYGRFYRRLPVGYDVKPDQITATLKDGVLEVRIPERSVSTEQQTRIPVS
jgi:HSP20 family protein